MIWRMAWIGLGDHLAVEAVKAQDLAKRLTKALRNLQAESNDHKSLRTAVGLVMDDLGMASAQGVSSLVVRAVGITDRARRLVRDALRLGVHRAFAIARSHYENIDLAAMSEGFVPSYTNA